MLRITSGSLRNRKITVPETGLIRPMLERTRHALFSILGQNFAEGRCVIDAFAGSGLLGLEALSRGAKHCTFFDLDRRHCSAIEKLAVEWKIEEQVRVHNTDVMKTLGSTATYRLPCPEGARLIFLDPPHAMSNELQSSFYDWFADLSQCPLVNDDTVVVFGHHARLEPPAACGRLQRWDSRKFGHVAVSMYDFDGANDV